MPTYVYSCRDCDHRFEAQQAFTDNALTECPNCGGKLRKVFNSVGIVFKGSGFYATDSRGKTTEASSGADAAAKTSDAKSSSDSPAKTSSESSPKSSESSSKSSSDSSSSSSSSSSSKASTSSSGSAA